MANEKDNSISFGVGLLAGVLAGTVAAVLYAPKSGEETRSDLKKVADKLNSNVPPEVVEAKDAGLELVEKVKCTIEAQFQKVFDTLKASRMAAAKKREETESGVDY